MLILCFFSWCPLDPNFQECLALLAQVTLIPFHLPIHPSKSWVLAKAVSSVSYKWSACLIATAFSKCPQWNAVNQFSCFLLTYSEKKKSKVRFLLFVLLLKIQILTYFILFHGKWFKEFNRFWEILVNFVISPNIINNWLWILYGEACLNCKREMDH